MADEKLKNLVRTYALDIEAAADGTLYKVNGEPTVIDDIDDWKQNEWERKKTEFLREHPFTDPDDKETYESEDEYVTDNIGEADDIDDPEQMSVMDFVKRSIGE